MESEHFFYTRGAHLQTRWTSLMLREAKIDKKRNQLKSRMEVGTAFLRADIEDDKLSSPSIIARDDIQSRQYVYSGHACVGVSIWHQAVWLL